jgi:hypothetical protein
MSTDAAADRNEHLRLVRGSKQVLSSAQADRFGELEAIVERGQQTFIEVGSALAEIRESRLYRADHPTFEDYCRDRWAFVASRGRQLIAAAETVTSVTVDGLPAPANEAVARALVPLLGDPERLREAWSEVVAEHGQKPTAEQVREHVEPRREKPPTRAASIKRMADRVTGKRSGATAKPTPEAATPRDWGRLSDYVRATRDIRDEVTRTLRTLSPEMVWRLADPAPLPGQVGADVLIELDKAALELSFAVSYLVARLLRPDQPKSWPPEPSTLPKTFEAEADEREPIDDAKQPDRPAPRNLAEPATPERVGDAKRPSRAGTPKWQQRKSRNASGHGSRMEDYLTVSPDGRFEAKPQPRQARPFLGQFPKGFRSEQALNGDEETQA